MALEHRPISAGSRPCSPSLFSGQFDCSQAPRPSGVQAIAHTPEPAADDAAVIMDCRTYGQGVIKWTQLDLATALSPRRISTSM